MGAHFSSKHYRRKLTMISKVAVLCVFATLAQAAPEAQWLGHAPVAYAAPDCAHSTQDLVAKSCHPVAKEVCTEEVAINQKIEYEEVCEDVVSKHCGHPGHVGLIKREAEADPQHLLGHLSLCHRSPCCPRGCSCCPSRCRDCQTLGHPAHSTDQDDLSNITLDDFGIFHSFVARINTLLDQITDNGFKFGSCQLQIHVLWSRGVHG